MGETFEIGPIGLEPREIVEHTMADDIREIQLEKVKQQEALVRKLKAIKADNIKF